mmetsp:Transcript_4320/g.12451  ORF Transcript_4320/g.12451 Transcript_4320/m.12451 type:complete len:312 (-) Transcript_4320:260-1195(-)
MSSAPPDADLPLPLLSPLPDLLPCLPDLLPSLVLLPLRFFCCDTPPFWDGGRLAAGADFSGCASGSPSILLPVLLFDLSPPSLLLLLSELPSLLLLLLSPAASDLPASALLWSEPALGLPPPLPFGLPGAPAPFVSLAGGSSVPSSAISVLGFFLTPALAAFSREAAARAAVSCLMRCASPSGSKVGSVSGSSAPGGALLVRFSAFSKRMARAELVWRPQPPVRDLTRRTTTMVSGMTMDQDTARASKKRVQPFGACLSSSFLYSAVPRILPGARSRAAHSTECNQTWRCQQSPLRIKCVVQGSTPLAGQV